jgi:N-dimethylarginine dimethylaminohydrolase
MCRPEHFAVTYTINPWMNPGSWARERRTLALAARKEWSDLYCTLREAGAEIELVPPVPGLPDLVFTANAAVVLDGKALLARFRYAERQPEEEHFEAAFSALRARGLITTIRKLPDDVMLEGAGDCVWDRTRSLFWMGYGQRSDASARPIVAEEFGVDILALELADPRFYHMDTALCPLSGGEVMYFPGAFTAAGQSAIHNRVQPWQRIEIAPEDAILLASNAICIDDVLILSSCSDRLRDELSERGYRVMTTLLGSFARSGGSAFCLTLRLDRTAAKPPQAHGDAGHRRPVSVET